MYSIIETVATVILLLLLMMFVLHIIRGDAADWFTSKFQVMGPENNSQPTTPAPNPNIPNDPLPPLPPNVG